MKHIRTIIQNLLRDENGQDLIEYALVAALIGLAAVAALNTLSGDVKGLFNSIGSALSSAIL
jgi:pilus assembly protein Flp/PilA